MVNEDIIRRLVDIYRNHKFGRLFFLDIAQMKAPHNTIDLDNCRKRIYRTTRMRPTREELAEIAKLFENLGLAKTFINENWSHGQNRFEWKAQMRLKDLAQMVIDREKDIPNSPSSRTISSQAAERVYMFKTESGKYVELTKNDIKEIKQLL